VDCYVNTQTLPERTGDWLEKIRPFNEHAMPLEPARVALLVIDMQEFFLDPASPSFTCGGLAILPNVRLLIDAFRLAGRPVIYTRHVHHPDHIDSGIMGWWWKGMCVEGTPESEVHHEIAPLPSEKVVIKHRYSGFYNTDLETVLRVQGIEQLVITGVMSNMCCESTARDAYFRDYRVFFLADATGSITEDMQLATLLNVGFGFAYVTTTDWTVDALQAGIPAAAAQAK
jgi:ureidoacrylate peracid hydrolase